MNNIGVVVNIEKILPALAKPEFLQFLLRHERSYHKDAVYFLFKKDNEKIGYVEVRGYGSEITPCPIQYFITKDFIEYNLERQMLNFAVNDIDIKALSATVENNDEETIQLYESLGFDLSSYSKVYLIEKSDVSSDEDLESVSFTSVSNLNKNLKDELNQLLEETVKNYYDAESDETKSEQLKSNYLETIKSSISENNSFVLINKGHIIAWLFFKVQGKDTLVFQDSAKSCTKQEYIKFVRAVFSKVLSTFKYVQFEVIGSDPIAKQILEVTDAKPKHVFYQYTKNKGDE